MGALLWTVAAAVACAAWRRARGRRGPVSLWLYIGCAYALVASWVWGCVARCALDMFNK